MSNYNIVLVSGTSNDKLCNEISDNMDTNFTLCMNSINRFSDGEYNIQINENVRGADVFIIQSTCRSKTGSVNDHIMELLLLIDALKRSSAKEITTMIPYFGYARQDRKTKPRVPISAKAIANILENSGITRIVTVDLHCGQIQGFFNNIPVDNLYAENIFVDMIKQKENFQDYIIVSPDAGGVTRSKRIADRLGGLDVVTIIKRRGKANHIEQMQIVGKVMNRNCIIVDDMIDTAGTLTKAAQLLKTEGATTVIACATYILFIFIYIFFVNDNNSHGVLSEPALDRIAKSYLSEVYVTDSIPQEENINNCKKLKVLNLAPLLSNAIQRIHNDQSLSILFKN